MRASWMVAIALVGGMLGAILFAAPRAADAHPMGNFSINHYARITGDKDALEIRYVLDMAEIPTFQEIQRTGIVPKVGDPSIENYLRVSGEALKQHLVLKANGRPLQLEQISHDAIFPPGAGGLPTMKQGFVYRAALAPAVQSGPLEVEYLDDNFPGRAGWKEVIAVANGSRPIAASSVPAQDRSHELSNYPTDLLNSPPQTLEARVTFSLGVPGATDVAAGSPLSLRANVVGTPRNAFTELIATRKMSFWFVITAVLISAALGAFHALEPGHGKTVVAAYLVGSRGKARHAVMLGLIVTASHTGGVYVLGAITLYASRYIVPERLYPWLGAVSGLIIAGLGMVLFVRRLEGADTDDHGHSHGHDYEEHPHSHGILGHSHSHGGDQIESQVDRPGRSHSDVGSSRPAVARPISRRELLALGITGGIIPCPAALVVLLGAMAVGRVGFGLMLIVAFSIGLAAALITTGLIVVFARRFMDRYRADGPIITRWLPLASSGVITAVGIVIALRSLITTGMF